MTIRYPEGARGAIRTRSRMLIALVFHRWPRAAGSTRYDGNLLDG